jgi:prefoldin alpha subunit
MVKVELGQQLQNLLLKRQEYYKIQLEQTKLENHLRILSENQTLKTLMNIKSNFFMHCRVKDTSEIIMNVGLNYFVKVPLETAKVILERMKKENESKIQEITDKIAKTRAEMVCTMKSFNKEKLASAV